MHSLDVFNPTGATEITTSHAPRLDTLEGKTIYILSNDSWQAHRTLPLIGDLLQERFPTATIVHNTEPTTGAEVVDSDEMADLVKEKGGQAAIIGNAA
ncbi:hypothetical protein ACFLWS_01200 [Chloroflexota bacterium]